MALKFLPAGERGAAENHDAIENAHAAKSTGVIAAPTAPAVHGHAHAHPKGAEETTAADKRDQAVFQTQADAPPCPECGTIMVRNAACYKCLNCGSTSGCS